MSILCDGSAIRQAIQDVGTSITVRTVSNVGYNEWGDATETTSDATITAFVTQLSGEEIVGKEVEFAAGDLRIFFKSTDSAYCVIGNRVLFNTKWYEIRSVIDAYSVYYYEAIAGRI